MVLKPLIKIMLALSLSCISLRVFAEDLAVDKTIESQFKSYDDLLKLDEIPEDIQILLFKKLNILLEKTRETREVHEEDEALFVSIINKSDEFELNDYDFDSLSEEYLSLTSQLKKEQFKLNFYGTMKFVTWNYHLQLKDQSGLVEPLYSKEKGFCFGAGVSYENAYWGMSSDICYAYMTATVGESSATIKYNQSNVPVDALVSTSSIFWKPKEPVSLGVGPLLVYHDSDYTPPNGGTINDTNYFSYGYHIIATWKKKNYKLNISIGDLNGYKSSIWQVGLKYIF